MMRKSVLLLITLSLIESFSAQAQGNPDILKELQAHTTELRTIRDLLKQISTTSDQQLVILEQIARSSAQGATADQLSIPYLQALQQSTTNIAAVTTSILKKMGEQPPAPPARRDPFDVELGDAQALWCDAFDPNTAQQNCQAAAT